MPPSIALIHGPPGVGKSKLRDAIAEASRICGRFNMKTAFNSINATEMGGHTTGSITPISNPIIPITEQQCTWDSNQTPVYGGTHFPSSKITLRHYFPLEPALAITVHKAQGRMLKRVIIALSYCDAKGCNFSYRQVHVALSRVRNSDHIRLLLTGESEAMQWMSLLYIDNLRPDPSIRFYFAGFRDCSIDNPNLNWLSNEWNARRANTVFKREMGLKDDQ